MKKCIFFILIVSALLLSSCSLLKCQHKSYSEQTVAATCTSEGYTVHTCEKCGESYTDNQVAALGHSYAEEIVAPNCFAEGYTKHICTACGDTYNDNSVAKTIHHFAGESCPNCGMEEITENITPDTEWYSEEVVVFDLTTKEQLAGLASLVNEGTNFNGVIIYLDADIDLEFYEWIPIGNSSNSFNGSFDGDGHTISGLKINANSDYVGLFGNVSGKICNVNIDQANVYVKRDHNYVSVLCGYSSGEIKNVCTKGFIEAPKANYVGAIVGAATPASIIYSDLTNEASINAANYVGGIFGHINSTGSLQTDSISNTGDVTGVSQVGGIVGYANADVGSKIYDASVCADIVGEYYVGGIAGKVENIAISTCTNDGSTVTANSYYTEGESFYAWLGGYVGYGYSVNNCVNNVDIKYDARGMYVGGIIGYATNVILDCTNNGDITTYTDCVGGVAGKVSLNIENNFNNLSNSGDVSGKSAVGGVFGDFTCVSNSAGYEYKGGRGNHYFLSYSTLKNVTNNGKVSGINNVAGVIGYAYLESVYDAYKGWCCNYYGCNHRGDTSINVSDIICQGDVIGEQNIGEIFGSFSSDGPSTLANYIVTGKVTVNGEVLEGEYDVGTKTNLTLSGREIPNAENTEVTE